MRSQIQRAAYLAGLVALAAIVWTGAARATTITVFNNFSGTPSFNQFVGYGVSGSNVGDSVQAMPFIASSTANLADAVLALGTFTASNDGPITLDLESNSSSGLPGTVLATLTQQGTIPLETSPGLVTFDYSGGTVALTSGTSYWLVALETDPNSLQEWFFSHGYDGPYATNSAGSATGPWLTIGSSNRSAFQVDGTTVATTAEPGTFSLLALGIFGLGALWVERRRKLSRCA
ncbi:MAG: hypothetical protein ACRD1O_12365 [Terriglobia bacterium]